MTFPRYFNLFWLHFHFFHRFLTFFKEKGEKTVKKEAVGGVRYKGNDLYGKSRENLGT